MQRAIPVLTVSLTALAHAEAPFVAAAFETRVHLARDAESDERFRTYHAAMMRRTGRHLARTIRSCRAAAPAPEHKSVVLVADISSNGKATAVEAKPDNAAGRCLAAGISAIRYPKPPVYPERPGFPVTMKISFAR